MFVVLEVAWPILMFVGLALMRRGFPASFITTCEYPERALLSAGMTSFLQTSICTLDNKCATREYHEQRALVQQRFRSMMADIGPILNKNTTVDALTSLPIVKVVLAAISNVSKGTTIQDIENKLVIRNLVRDDDEVVRILSNNYQIFTPAEANVLLNSSLDAVAIISVIGTTDFKDIVCDHKNLSRYIMFTKDVNVTLVSERLCGIKDELISNITNDLVRQLDIVKIIRLGQDVANVFGAFNYTELLSNFGDLVAMYLNSSSLLSILGPLLPNLRPVPNAIRAVVQILPLLQDMTSIDFKRLSAVFNTIAPTLQTMSNGNTIVTAVQDLLNRTSRITASISGNGWDFKTIVQALPDIADQLNVINNLLPPGISMPAVLNAIPVKDVSTMISTLMASPNIDMATILMFLNSTVDNIDSMTSLSSTRTARSTTTVASHVINMIDDTRLFYNSLTADLKYMAATNPDIINSLNGLVSVGPEKSKKLLINIVTMDNFYNVLKQKTTVHMLCVKAAMEIAQDMQPSDAKHFAGTVCNNESTDAVARVLSPDRLKQLSDKMTSHLSEIQVLLNGQGQTWSMTDLYNIMYSWMTEINTSTGTNISEWALALAHTNINFTKEWIDVWDALNAHFVVQARVLMPMMVTAESMEQSTLWSSVSSTIKMSDAVLNAIVPVFKKIEALDIDGQIRPWIVYIPYLPYLVQSAFRNNNTELTQTATSGDILKAVCQGIDWTHLNLSGNVSANIKATICTLNQNNLMGDLVTIANPAAILTEVASYTLLHLFDSGMNWTGVSSNIQYLYDVLWRTSGSLQDLWAIFMSDIPMLLNNSYGLISTTLSKFTTATTGNVTNTDYIMTTEQQMDGWLQTWPLWKQIKHYVVAWTLFAKALNEYADTFKDSIKTSVSKLYSLIYFMVYALVDILNPQTLMYAMNNIVRNPQTIIGIMTMNFDTICSDDTLLSNLLGINLTQGLMRFQQELCGLNWTFLIAEVSKNSDSWNAFYTQWKIISNVQTDALPTISINWTDAVHTTEVFLSTAETIVQSTSLLNWSELVMNGSNSSVTQLANILHSASVLDMNQVLNSIDNLVKMLYNASTDSVPALNVLRHQIAIDSYVLYHVLTFLNKQFQYLNSKDAIDIKEYTRSEEANKILGLLDKSLDLNAVLLNTIKETITTSTDFSKMIVDISTLSFVEICNDTTNFEAIIKIPSTSNMTKNEVMTALCAANIDLNKLLTELTAAIDGLSGLVNAFEMVASGNMSDADFFIDYSHLLPVYEAYLKLLETFNNKTFTFVLPWMNTGKEIQWLLEQLGNFSHDVFLNWTSTDIPGLIMQYQNQDLFTILSVLNMPAEFSYILRVQQMYMKAFISMIYRTKGIMLNPEQELKDYPEMIKIWAILEMLPDLYQIYTYTSLRDPGKITTFFESLSLGISGLCVKTPYELMTDPPDVSIHFSTIVNMTCSINMTALEQECDSVLHNEDIIYFNANSTVIGNNTVSIVDWMSDYKVLMEAIQQLTNTSEIANIPRFVYTTIWEQATKKIASSLVNITNVSNLLIERTQLFQNILSLQLFPPEVTYILHAQQIFMLGLPTLINRTEAFLWDPMAELKDYTEITKIWNMLEMLPDLYQIYSYTALIDGLKVAKLLGSLALGREVFCLNNPYDFMSDPPGISVPFSNMFHTFCSLNVSALRPEYENFFAVQKLQDLYASNNMTNNQTVSIEDWINTYNWMLKQVTQLTNKTLEISIPRFMNSSLWEQVTHYAFDNLMNLSSISKLMVQWQNQVLYNILSNAVVQPEVAYVIRVQQMFMQVLPSIMKRTNVTFVNLETWLNDYPEMTKIWSMLELLPELYQIYSYTELTYSSKIITFVDSLTKGMNDVCLRDPSSFMATPPGLNVSLKYIFDSFCSLNMSALDNEYQSFVQLQEIKDFYNNNSTSNQAIDLVDWINAYQRLMQYVSQLSNQTGDITIPRFLNSSLWLQTTNHSSDIVMNITSYYQLLTQSQYLALYSAVSMQIVEPEVQYVFRVIQNYMQVLPRIMNQTGAAFWDPSTVLTGYPEMHKIWSILETLPELYQIYFYTAITNSSKVATFIMSLTTGMDALCLKNSDELMSNPPSINTTFSAIFDMLCSLNISSLKQEYENFIAAETTGIHYMMNNTTSNRSVLVEDLLNAYGNLWAYFENATNTYKVTSVPRLINTSVWVQATEFVNSLILNMSTLIQKSDILNNIRDDLTLEAKEALMSVDAILEFALDKIGNISENGSLANAWKNSSQIIGMLESLASVGNFTNSQYGAYYNSINPEKFLMLFLGNTSIANMCANKTLAVYISKTTNATVMSKALEEVICINVEVLKQAQQDMEALHDKLTSIWNGNNIQAAFNWTAITERVNKFVTLYTSWMEKQPNLNEPLLQWLNWKNISNFVFNSITDIQLINNIASSISPLLGARFGNVTATLTDMLIQVIQKLQSATFEQLVNDPMTWMDLLKSTSAIGDLLNNLTNILQEPKDNTTSAQPSQMSLATNVLQIIVKKLTEQSLKQNLLNSTAEVMVKQSTYGLLNLIEAFGDTSVLQKLRNSILVTMRIQQYVDSMFQKLAENTTLSVTSILPSSDLVSFILRSILGDNGAIKFFTASLNPLKLYFLLLNQNWNDTLCDKAQFNTTFVFPIGVEVQSLQEGLCKAFTEQSDSVKQLLNAFEIDKLLTEVNNILVNNTTDVNEKLLSDMVIMAEKFTIYLSNLENIKFAGIAEWVTSVIQMTNGLLPNTDQYPKTCENLLQYMSYIPSIGNSGQSLLNMFLGLTQASYSAMHILTDINNAICPKEITVRNITQMIDEILASGIPVRIQTLMQSSLNEGDFSCSNVSLYVMLGENITSNINTLTSNPSNVVTCLGETFTQLGTLVQDIVRLYENGNEIAAILAQNTGLLDLFNAVAQSNETMAVIESGLDVFRQQDAAVKTLISLLKQNATELAAFFENTFATGPDALLQILNFVLLQNSKNLTSQNIIESICSSDSSLSNLSLAIGQELDSTLCGTNLVLSNGVANSLLQYMRDVVQLKYLETSYISTFTASVTKDLENLIADIGGTSDLLGTIGELSKMDISMFANSNTMLRTVQMLLTNSGPDVLVNSLNKLWDNFKLLDGGIITNFVLSDAKKIANGVFAFTSIRNFLASNIHLEDIVKDKTALRNYLLTNLSMSAEVSDAIISGNLSFETLLTTVKTNVNGWACNSTRLAQLLLVRQDLINVTHISQQLCSLDKDTVTALLDELIGQINIGDLMEEIFVSGIKGLFERTNASVETTKDALKKLTKAAADIQAMISLFGNYTASVPGMVDTLLATIPDSSGLSNLSPFICGDKINEIGDEFHVADTSSANITLTDLQKNEMYQLPGQTCQKMYVNILSQKNGQVIWSFLKPILRGRILFAPNTSDIKTIIKKMNSSFEILDEVVRLSSVWAEGSHLLTDLINNASGNLNDLLHNPLVKSMLTLVSGLTVADFDNIVHTLEHIDSDMIRGVNNVAQIVANHIRCIVSDRFKGYASEQELEEAALKQKSNDELLAGIIFGKITSSDRRKKRQSASTIPPHIHYKIRMDIDNVARTNRLKYRLWRPEPLDDFFVDMRYFRGFIQLQDMVEDAIIRTHIGDDFKRPAVITQQIPFPCHIQDKFVNTIAGYLLPVILTFSWIAGISVAVYNLVYDRERGQEETLHAMGLGYGLNWLAWFFTSILMMAFVDFVDTIILRFADIFDRSNMGIIYLYIMDFMLSTMMMCYFVSAFFTRTSIAILASLIVYLLSYLPFAVVYSMELQMNFWQKTIACLSSTTAISYAAQFIARYEEQEIGLQWSNIREDPINVDGFSFSWACIMAFIDAAIYFCLGWYIRSIKPGKFGIPEPWHFIVSPSFWCGRCAQREDKYAPATKAVFSEEITTDTPVVISARGLTKAYHNGTDVVKNLSLDIHSGCVTTLLGHNGAAKTTTMNMLIGLLEPTKGTVSILNRPLKQMKGSIGVCTQHNSLYDYMTVEEHMKFYQSIKDSSEDSVSKGEIERLLNDVGLWYCRHTIVKNLSGGMQRRLSVAIAFVGSSKAVILDEPTSGVDPNGRRAIWNMILKKKAGVAILLSTHHLDEADVISDQIAIMHQGSLLCQGSPMFLKKHFASGHRLTIVKEPSSDLNPMKVLAFLKKWFPGVRLHQIAGTDLTFVLPSNTHTDFNSFFQDLEAQRLPLRITDYGISDPHLEEVFLKVCTAADLGRVIEPKTVMDLENITKESLEENQHKQKLNSSESEVHKKKPKKAKLQGFSLMCQQFGALLVKRFHHYRRDWKSLLSVVILPLVLVVAGCGFYRIRPTGTSAPNLYLSPAMYGPSSYVFVKQDSRFNISNSIIDTFIRNPGIGSSCMKDMKDTNLGAQYRCREPYTGYSVPASNISINGTCLCENKIYVCKGSPYGEAPKKIITSTTEILQHLENKDTSQYLLDSYLEFKENRYGGWTFHNNEPGISSQLKVKIWYNNFGWHAMPAFYNAYSNGLLRAMMNDSEADMYGISVYNHPFLFNKEQLDKDSFVQNVSDIGIALIFLVAFTFVPLGAMMYSVTENIKSEKHMQFVSGVGPFMYWITSLIWDFLILGIAIGIAVCIIAMFRPDSFWDRHNLGAVVALFLLYGWATIPIGYGVVKLFHSAGTAFFTMFCIFNIIGILLSFIVFVLNYFQAQGNVVTQWYTIIRYVFLVFPPYCLTGGLIDIINNQIKASIMERFGMDVYVNPFSFQITAWNLIAMTIQGFVFFCLTIILDCRYCCYGRRQNWLSRRDDSQYVDSDVAAERHRIKHMRPLEDVVVIKDLYKVFTNSGREVHAVNGLSFGVLAGQCFGLLGINGAGKTTTFNILTGALSASKGSAFILKKKIHQNFSEVGQEIGYCPQHEALDDYLNVLDTLYFYCKLKGMPCGDWSHMVNNVIEKLKMNSIKRKLVKSCSGGMKRKLSLAIALLGDPAVLLLDEPTSGLDPKAKRLVWDCLTKAKQNGQAIILTSHSLEECDILCDKIGIMVNGEFKCMGSSQHLKKKFSQGYTVTLYLCGLRTITRALELVQNNFPSASIGEQHMNVILLHIPKESIGVAELFGILEREKRENNILYYTVCQTTLDTIFLNFARDQSDGLALEVAADSSSENSCTETPPETTSFDSHFKSNIAIFKKNMSVTNNPYTNGVYIGVDKF